ncbi:MAG: ComF family protein [Deltaproteobacteria bacterium]|nr:ComF family protein [Deltaproteobacteria bacterium]
MRALLADLWALVLPAACHLCGATGAGIRGPLCADCLAAVPRLAVRVCRVCGVPRPGARELCATCRAQPRRFHRARAVAPYVGTVHTLIQRYKYDRVHALAAPLVELLVARDPFAAERPDAVVAVPLAPARLRHRGFNQAALLARGYARARGLRYVPRALARRAAATTQAASSRAARRRNVSGAFRVARPRAISGGAVLLVDDVVTTCATADACAAALRQAGARRVDVLAVARTGVGEPPL